MFEFKDATSLAIRYGKRLPISLADLMLADEEGQLDEIIAEALERASDDELREAFLYENAEDDVPESRDDLIATLVGYVNGSDFYWEVGDHLYHEELSLGLR